MKFGLRTTRVLLAALGHPEHAYPSIHIAGTNGKGSTASMLASIFMESGYRAGLYTSPHLVRFTERIRIDGREIPGRRVVHYTRVLFPIIEELRATFFEVVTCIAFRHFADEHIDIAVVETGLGGRLDSTNVITPLVSVITTIGFDHEEYLGTTLRSIAREKGGIIKPGIPCVTGADQPAVLSVLGRIAYLRKTRLFRAGDLVSVTPGRNARTGLEVRARSLGLRRVSPGLTGPHQTDNLRVAVAVCELLLRTQKTRAGFRRLTPAAVARGCARVTRNTGLRGRCEIIGVRKRTILDVAHNPAGMRALVTTLQERGERNILVLFGVMKDKDYRAMLAELKPVTGLLIAVEPATPRALGEPALRRAVGSAGMRVVRGGSVPRGVRLALRLRGRAGTLLVTGSHYVVGEARHALRLP